MRYTLRCAVTWLGTLLPLLADTGLPLGVTIRVGAVNACAIERQGKRLLVYGDPSDAPGLAAMCLLTHARRDVMPAVRDLARRGIPVFVPDPEQELVTEPEKFWIGWQEKRFHDYAQQSTKVPAVAVPAARSVRDGEKVAWEGLEIRVVSTPGYTRGAVSYLLDLEGKRIAFTGDLIRDDGKLQDLFSLQDAIPDARIGGYHGWAGRLGELVASLEQLMGEKPDLLVPVRGPVIRDPQGAIQRLLGRIRSAYANYLSIDALRWYFKDEHMLAKARRVLAAEARVDWMSMGETRPLPGWILPFSNSRLLLASDGSGFLVDCGSTGIVEDLRKLRSEGRLVSVEHVFVTHYHDDHTDALPVLVQEFGAKVYACGSLIDVLERPGDYRLPCLTKNPVTVTGRRAHGDTWRWKEYRVTIFDFPGQTLHHNGLLVERDSGEAVFFAGDSFTPSGIDDYCLQNRNFVAPGEGYLRCLDLLEGLPTGCWVLNQHVEPAFRFSIDQVARMRQTLEQRIPLLKDLFVFDDPNFGLDAGWATLHPYAVRIRPGESARLELRVRNHSPRERTFRSAVHAGTDLAVACGEPVWIAGKSDGAIDLRVTVSGDAKPGLRLVTADVAWEDGELPEWVEALVEIH